METELSRRNFLKGTAVIGVGGLLGANLAGCAEDVAPTPIGPNIDWDYEADIVVLGAGDGGLFAATFAARAGASVLLLEKAREEDSGGNSRVAGNMWTIATDATEGMKYYLSAAEKDIDKDYLTALVDSGTNHLNNEWLPSFPDMSIERFPIFSPEFDALPGGDVIKAWQNGGASKSQLWLALEKGCKAEENVEFMYETPGKRLITNTDGMVIGVVAENAGAEINVKAKKAVILGVGGYEFNPNMIKNSYPGWPVFSRGTPYNTGDGIAMAQKVGAQLWHMNASDSGSGAMRVPGLNYGHGAYDSDDVPANVSLNSPNDNRNRFFFVDKYGKRFMSENRPDGHGYGRREYLFFYDGVECLWPRLPYWNIFDQTEAENGPVGAGANPNSTFSWFTYASGYTWSADNSAEVEKGWILKADTIEELAEKMTAAQADERKHLFRDGIVVDPAVLRKTLDDYNAYCRAGNDPDFGRNPNFMVPLEGPFYAFRVYPNQYNTQGGPKRNTKAQTLDAFDEPIPHLYSIGECGAGYAWVYNGGWNIAEAMITGHWAAENAVLETPWDEPVE